MKKQISKLLLLTLLALTMATPQFALARVNEIGSVTSSTWTTLVPSTVIEGDWLKIAAPVGAANGSAEGSAYNFASPEIYPEGSSLIYTANFKTGKAPESTSQSCWFRIVVTGNLWINLFQVAAEPGQPLKLEFASNEEVRFNATDFDSVNGMALEYETEYTMKITLKPNIGSRVKFVAELYDADGKRIGAGMIENYSFVNTEKIRQCTGLRLVSYRSSKISAVEPVAYVGAVTMSVDFPDTKPEANFFPENGSENADMNGRFYMNFPTEIEEISEDNVTISSGAGVESVYLSSNGKKLDFEFSNLKPSTKYDVKIKGVKVLETQKTYDYDWSFTTSYQVDYLPRANDVIFDDDLSTAEFVNFGPDAVSGWSSDEAFSNGEAYSGNRSSISQDTELEMIRQDADGLVFSTAKLAGTQWSGKNTYVRKKFKSLALDETYGLKMTFDFTTGEKIPQDFYLWCYINNWKARPFAYNAKDATITFASSNGNVWMPRESTDGKSSFVLEENTDYSLTMEILKNPVSGISDMTLTICDADGNKLDSAFFENYSDMPDINSLPDFTIQSQTNVDCSEFDSVDYITVKNIKAEGVYEGRDNIVSGDNTIVVPWKNALPDESFTSTFIAVTEITDGDVVSVDDISVIKFENITGESGAHEITVNVPDALGRAVKIYAVNDVEGMIVLSDVYELK